MLSLSHDSENRILLFTVRDILTTDDVRRIKQLAKQCGAGDPELRTIVDLVGVRASAVPESFLAQCSRLPERWIGEPCIVVAPQSSLQELVLRYAREQRDMGGAMLYLVISLRMALDRLEIEIANFEQVEFEQVH